MHREPVPAARHRAAPFRIAIPGFAFPIGHHPSRFYFLEETMENPSVKKSWFSRYWWLLALAAFFLIVLPVVCCVGTVGASVVGVFGIVRSSPVFTDSLEMVQGDSRAQDFLGTPIEAGWLVNGEISETLATGTAEISYPVSGSKGSGTAYVSAKKVEGEWVITRLVLVMDKTKQRLVIVGKD
jgi:hypothetical protein